LAVSLVGERQAGGQGGDLLGRLRIIRLATFEHRLLVRGRYQEA
jgi:hypothetical protein